jgi:hypothetical protein
MVTTSQLEQKQILPHPNRYDFARIESMPPGRFASIRRV